MSIINASQQNYCQFEEYGKIRQQNRPETRTYRALDERSEQPFSSNAYWPQLKDTKSLRLSKWERAAINY